MPADQTEPPIINCHTHIFNSKHVPPYLAKTFVPWPFYYLIHLQPIVALFRWCYKGPATIKYTPWYKQLVKAKTNILAFFDRLYPLTILLGYYVFFFAFFLIYELAPEIPETDATWLSEIIEKFYKFTDPIFPDITATWLKVLIVA